ncbi:MAG: zinc-dependent alcohol dehydrogenase family protein [Deltaproteobacteria bacterium]|nr:zinc-dependent alcohol dehydrogenase family protein [Deltaproteobacteria bacterium]
MRAMLLERPAPIESAPLVARDLPDPEPGPGEIRMAVRACGVCHTDLHVAEGDLTLPRLPVVPGHQVVGVVERLGAGVEMFRAGDRVGLPWLRRTCGACDRCRNGRENLCEHAEFNGFHADGGFAEKVLAPAEFAYRVPDAFPDAQAAPLLCAGVIGYRALRLSTVRPGERLGMWGFGASAHVTIQVAVHRGCEVHVLTRSEAHRRHARELGAVWTGAPSDPPPRPLDAAIIFSPAGPQVHDALRALRPGGTLALAGITMSPIPELEYPLLYGERTVRSVANSTRRDVEELLELAPRIPIRTEVEEYRLEEANGVLRRLKESRIRGAGLLVP